MKHFHDLRAFLNNNAALEVRDMSPSALGNKVFSWETRNKEVLVC